MATQSVATESSRSTNRAAISAKTLRTDRWWLQPLFTALVFAAFVVYATWAAFNHPLVFGHGSVHRIFYAKPYLSPFYSPCFADGCPTEVQWGQVDIWHWISPALYILIFPLSFRLTCYYYRKAYYRSFWFSPPACAVSEPHKKYSGETRFPLILQNIHRYFFWLLLIFNVVLTYDAVVSFQQPGIGIGIGVGTVILCFNAAFLWLYSLSCHACRHFCGGQVRSFAKHPLRHKLWKFVTPLNGMHMRFAWASLFIVAFSDLYVRLVASGTIHDPAFHFG